MHLSFLTFRKSVLSLALTIPLALIGGAVRAQTFVVAPNAFANSQPGFTANSAPFNNQSRYQQIYGASEFSAISTPQLITQITFRPATNESAFATTRSDIQFNLSTAATSVAGLSSTFDDNVGADDTIVFNGVWDPSSANAPGPGNTKAFDIVLDLTTPFLYDPTVGALLLDIRNASPVNDAFFVDLGSDPSTRLLFADAPPETVTTGTIQDFGIATRFTFVTVPEVGSSLLLSAGIVPLGAMLLRRRKAR